MSLRNLGEDEECFKRCTNITHKFESSEFEQFFRKLQLEELLAPMLITPAPINALPGKYPGKQNRRLVPTVQELPYLVYKIGGHLWYPSRGKHPNEYKDPPLTDPAVPYTAV